MSKRDTLPSEICEFLLRRAVDGDGEGWATVREIAQGVVAGERAVRNALHGPSEAPRSVVMRESSRMTYSKDYPMMECGAHRVYEWSVSRRFLCARLAKAEGGAL